MIFTSIFGIAALVLLARALGFAKAPVLDGATARNLAEAALPGFRGDAVALDTGGRAALVRGDDDRVALVRPHGDRWVVRLVDRADPDGARLRVRPREAMFGATTLDFGDAAPGWARRLAA